MRRSAWVVWYCSWIDASLAPYVLRCCRVSARVAVNLLALIASVRIRAYSVRSILGQTIATT